ncbi:hypothetical protein HPB49_012607 [Dermacentor silvarum]|uniref:Uncharacterized protein n=1 Tax=Dermacentor silvarum TaxID=543639 RepID=A0ACB8E099_DERSI|nr:hypothetical protein HPB49_012607 [Dermacentor silvarum]
MRPIDVVCDTGFLSLADELIAVGARHGTVPTKDVFPHPTTASRKVAEVAGALRESLKPGVHQAMEEGRCACTVGVWTDDYKVAYTSVTVHYINKKWELISLDLFTSDFPPENSGEH